MGSLPSHFESEKEQLEVIRQLQKENEIAGEKLAQATQLAGFKGWGQSAWDYDMGSGWVRKAMYH
eukprot:1361811-Amorphochlora_amoeboformis.AAC.1